ncbi:MAG: hypothetical protein WBW48_07025 [Anaerolineae bacterium]
MRRKIGCGLWVVIILIIIYLTETAILGSLYRFWPEVPYKFVAPPVVIAAMAVAWLAIYNDMDKRGER